ncbi:PHP domain-containing protein [Candidatus Woesearchaeota archaeon]|nr:PHP domain-containing protein [Candidatus Woesearchaeota archaeon]
MKYDLHIHTYNSPCAVLKPKTILKIAKKKGLNGIAVTDHNTIKGALEVRKLNKDRDFEVITGSEIKTDKGDLLAYYITKEIRSRNLLDTIDEIKKQGGLIAVPHPFRTMPWLRFRHNISEIAKRIDAIEAFNSRMLFPWENRRAEKIADNCALAKIGSSDAHFSFDIGRAYTLFEGDLRDAIKKKKTKAEGSIILGSISGTLGFFQRRVIHKLRNL